MTLTSVAAQCWSQRGSSRLGALSVETPGAAQSAQPELRIGSGDLLEIKVYGAPELSGSARVSNSGDVTIPLIGTFKISGFTVEEAQQQVAERFRRGGYLRDPQVNILIKEFATQGVSVLGEVARPGIYPLLGSRRLFDAISAAGGTTSRAGNTIVVAHRDRPSAADVVELSSSPKESAQQNLELQPGDTVTISKAGIVYVSGDVKLPGGYLMDNNHNLTVLQALALAQGLNPTASSKSTRIIRRSRGKFQDIPVALKQIMEAKAPDISLESEDVLFVPSSASKSAARRSLESIVQVATGLAIYRR
jgi:polysaccharide export outer membrane protein